MEYIVNQYDVTVIDRKRKLGWSHLGIHTYSGEVIPIKGNIQIPQWQVYLQEFVQSFRDPYAACMDSNHRRIGEVPAL
jgi:hypothetical protein